MMLGILGGWIAGGICMYYVWDKNFTMDWRVLAIPALKVFGAATAGSLLGTFLSWFMPGTRRRMKVIKELKIHLNEARRMEAEIEQQAALALAEPRLSSTARNSLPPDQRYATGELRRAAPTGELRPRDRSTSELRPRDERPTAELRPSARPEQAYTPREPAPRRPVEIERVEIETADGSPDALLQALEQFGQGLEKFQTGAENDDKHHPR